MYQIDFKKPMHIHFIGIGGISMSGLASILLKQHFKVSGSDAHESELTKQLEAEGAILYYGQRASNLMTHRIWWSTQPPSTRTIRNMPLR